MARYVDGYLIPIPKRNLKKYKKMAALGMKTWMKCGALDYYECVGDILEGAFSMKRFTSGGFKVLVSHKK